MKQARGGAKGIRGEGGGGVKEREGGARLGVKEAYRFERRWFQYFRYKGFLILVLTDLDSQEF